MTEEERNLEFLFTEPEHWQRAEALIADINRLNGLLPDASLHAENSTKAGLEGYPSLIKFSLQHGNENEARKREQRMRELEIRSATETGIYVRLMANSSASYDALKMMLFQLFEKYQAEQSGGDDTFGDSNIPYDGTGKPFTIEKPLVGIDLFFTCKQKKR